MGTRTKKDATIKSALDQLSDVIPAPPPLFDMEQAESAYSSALSKAKAMTRPVLNEEFAILVVANMALERSTEHIAFLFKHKIQAAADAMEHHEKLASSRRKGGSLAARHPDKHAEKLRIQTLYLQCGRGDHPKVRTTEDFCNFALKNSEIIAEFNTIRRWITKEWEPELDLLGLPRPAFGSHNKYPGRKELEEPISPAQKAKIK